MKATKKLVLMALIAPIALGSASVLAFGGGKGGHGPEPRGFEQQCRGGGERGVMKQLNLSDEQKAQLKQMREQSRQAMKEEMQGQFAERQAEMKAFHAKEQQLVLADNFDAQAANALALEMAEKQAQMRVKMMNHRHDMLSVLSDEQKQQYVTLVEVQQQECAQKMAEHRQKRQQKANND